MDVILDSNICLSDIRMSSISFKNLFDYLRRTKSQWVLPRIVRDEVVAKYVYRLDNQWKRTVKAIDDLNALMLDSKWHVSYMKPDVRAEGRAFRKRMLAGISGIKPVYYSDVTGVDVNEVFLRGINRRRPASKDGEELRDVILWLIALHYADTQKRPIAFLTADSGFWEEEKVHPHIQRDIKERGVEVHLFSTIDDFIRHNAPAPKPVTSKDLEGIFDFMTLGEEVAEVARLRIGHKKFLFFPYDFAVASVEVQNATLLDGTSYEISKETRFLELTYSVSIRATVLVIPQNMSRGSLFGGGLASIGRPGWSAPGGLWAGSGSPFFGAGSTGGPVSLGPGLMKGFGAVQQLGGYSGFGQQSSQGTEDSRTEDWQGKGLARVMLRITEGAISESELDDVEISKVVRLSKGGVADRGVEIEL